MQKEREKHTKAKKITYTSSTSHMVRLEENTTELQDAEALVTVGDIGTLTTTKTHTL